MSGPLPPAAQAVVRVFGKGAREIILLSPGGALAPMSEQLVGRTLDKAGELSAGVYRVECGEEPVVTRVAEADREVAAAVMRREAEESVVIERVVLSSPQGPRHDEEALAAAEERLVYASVAAAQRVPVGTEFLVEVTA